MHPKARTPAFIADCHLGKVAKYLRMMGYDTLYFPQIGDDALIAMAREQNRTILTRDHELSQRKQAPALLLHSTGTKEQLSEIVRIFSLDPEHQRCSRCIVCNTPLHVIEKAGILDRLPKKVARYFDFFEYCPQCDRIYWHGDHYRRMQAFIVSIFHNA